MKVALLNIHFHRKGGSERRTYELAKGLLREGCEVHVYAHTFDAALSQPNLYWHRVPLLKFDSAARVLSYAYFCREMVKREGYDIVHSQARTLYQDLVTVGYNCHKEYLSMLRETMHSRGRYVIKRIQLVHLAILLLEKRQYTSRRCAKLIAISQLTKRGLLRYHNYPSADISVVYNGVDAEEFSPERCLSLREQSRLKLGIKKEDCVLLLVGHEYHRKGVADLIYALAEISLEKRKGMKALVVGKGQSSSYRRLSRESGVSDAIRFVGNQLTILPFYAAADIFVLPSRLDSFSNAVLEAMACGLPVIISQETGASEIVSDGESGIVLKEKRNPVELAQSILSLSVRERSVSMGRRARARATTLTWNRSVKETIQVYEKILQQKG